MIYGDVPPGDSAERDGAHQVPNIAQGGDGVAVEPSGVHAQNGVVELINLRRTAQMHANVVLQ